MSETVPPTVSNALTRGDVIPQYGTSCCDLWEDKQKVTYMIRNSIEQDQDTSTVLGDGAEPTSSGFRLSFMSFLWRWMHNRKRESVPEPNLE